MGFIDFHIVYAGLCLFLVTKHAGHVSGLDSWAAKLPFVESNAMRRWRVA
jgi:hypothetical protein